jgi:hypothetical protein
MLTFNDKLHVLTAPADMLPLGNGVARRHRAHPRHRAGQLRLRHRRHALTVVAWTEAVLTRAHVYFALLELDLRSAQNILRFIRALKAEALPHDKVRYVLNRAPKFTDLSAKARVKRMAESLDIDIEVQLPDGGEQVTQANDHGLPIAESAGKNPLRKELQKLAKSLYDLNKSAEPPGPDQGEMTVFSRFKKDTPAGESAQGVAAAAAPADKAAFGPSGPAQAPVRSATAAEAVAADKEKKRKERLTELKVEIHKRLLEDLNLSAIESATEQSLGPRSPRLPPKRWTTCRSR